ncbi:hypothetical protein L2E82_02084 [Cichorium intybus]|uniref:Uncharacterized protein n=1 Tax=Cichorium intybus TaxID=13427 RepID=A0ACB9H1B9_CICIN|nr:hypothetical protein L2E82_02084 [Cichorium intybus]
MIPMADMAVLFASRGLQTTIITTPTNASCFSKSIQKTINYHHQIALHIIPGSGNPDLGVSDEFLSTFYEAISELQEPVEQFIQESHPNCIVADMFYPWTTEVATKFNIPRIVFNGTGFFPQCVVEAVGRYDLAKNVSSDSELFTVPNLPHEIKLSRKQLPHLEAETFKGYKNI